MPRKIVVYCEVPPELADQFGDGNLDTHDRGITLPGGMTKTVVRPKMARKQPHTRLIFA